jgi:carboxylesterase type B
VQYIFRDAYFLNHIYRSVRYHASSHLPVYFYQFSHTSDVGVVTYPGVSKTGAAHSDELAYLFPERTNDMSGDDGVVQKHLLLIWSNFVKYL